MSFMVWQQASEQHRSGWSGTARIGTRKTNVFLNLHGSLALWPKNEGIVVVLLDEGARIAGIMQDLEHPGVIERAPDHVAFPNPLGESAGEAPAFLREAPDHRRGRTARAKGGEQQAHRLRSCRSGSRPTAPAAS